MVAGGWDSSLSLGMTGGVVVVKFGDGDISIFGDVEVD